MRDNPFDHYDIDPLEGPEGITARLRALMEEADDEERREALRAVWEHLTLHPDDRLKAALGAFPETRPTLGEPPPLADAPAPLRLRWREGRLERGALGWRDVGLRPAVASALSPHPHEPPPVLPRLQDDPMVALVPGAGRTGDRP